jgi:hypothetical protein
MVAAERAHYQAYMLRIWKDQDEPGSVWCASLESPHTGERHGFDSLEALFDFLRQRADQQGDGCRLSSMWFDVAVQCTDVRTLTLSATSNLNRWVAIVQVICREG